MNTNEITSQDVAEYLQSVANKVNETHGHVQVRGMVCQNQEFPSKAKFSIYCSREVQSADHGTIEECLAEIASITPQTAAAMKREAAAKLLAEADELEAS